MNLETLLLIVAFILALAGLLAREYIVPLLVAVTVILAVALVLRFT